MDATATVRLDGRTTYAVEIRGPLPVYWAGNLLAALAARNIDVVSGRGRGANRDWTAALVVNAGRASTTPDRLDLIALARSEVPPAGDTALRLTRFELNPLADGRLELRVYAPDQTGFLTRLLRSLALVSLFVREFDIDTPGGQIRDRFVISGAGGAVSPSARRALEKVLRGYTG